MRLLAEPLKVVVSTPEISYCPDNVSLHKANVMEYIVRKSEQYPDLIKMGFDFAGSKTTNPKDAPIWDELFGDIELEMPGLIQAWKTVARKSLSCMPVDEYFLLVTRSKACARVMAVVLARGAGWNGHEGQRVRTRPRRHPQDRVVHEIRGSGDRGAEERLRRKSHGHGDCGVY